MKLYEIDQQTAIAIDALLNSVNEETGEVDEEAAQALEALQVSRAEKLESLGCVIKNLMAEQEAIKKEADALTARAKTKANEIERLKNYVAMSLLNANESKFEGTKVVFSFRKSTKVEIGDQSILPKKYLVKKVSIEPDKTALKKAMEDGKVIDGASLVIKQNLQVK